MKKIIAILIVAVLCTLSVMAAFEEEANIGNVKFTIGKAESAPVLGQFDTSKYTKIEPGAGDMSYAWDDSLDNGLDIAKGQFVETYLAYDANNVYGLVFTDTKYYENTSDDADSNAWQMSCIQISAAAGAAEGTERLEYGIWRKSDDGALGAVIWAGSTDNTDAAVDFEPVAGTNYTVALQGDKLAYEFVLPMNTFLAKPAVEGEVIAFSLVMAQRAEDVYVHTQIASGCTGNGKTAENFMRLTLGAVIAPPVVDEPAADEPVAADTADAVVTPVTTVAPAAKTGDAGIITLAVVMMIAAAGIVIFRKKSAAK